MCRFTGEETRDEVFAQAKEFFEDVQVSAMKLDCYLALKLNALSTDRETNAE